MPNTWRGWMFEDVVFFCWRTIWRHILTDFVDGLDVSFTEDI